MDKKEKTSSESTSSKDSPKKEGSHRRLMFSSKEITLLDIEDINESDESDENESDINESNINESNINDVNQLADTDRTLITPRKTSNISKPTITFLNSSNKIQSHERVHKSTHEELEDLFEDIPTPSYLFDNDAIDFNKDTQKITRITEDIETQVIPIIRASITTDSPENDDLFDAMNSINENTHSANTLLDNTVIYNIDPDQDNNIKDTILLSSEISSPDIKVDDSSHDQEFISSNISKETLDISVLDSSETLDELLEVDFSKTSSNSKTADTPNKHPSEKTDINDANQEKIQQTKDREILIFQHNLKYGVDKDVSDMMTKPFKRTSGYDLPKRYTFTELLGLGGMGEVIRVKDDILCRYVAMKILRQDFASHKLILSRFREEAQITAQLCHPNIIPVYELGTLPDGRSFFTMKEVDGDTLDDVIADLHLSTKVLPQESEIPIWGESDQGFAFRDVIDIFHRVCVAIAYAHKQGVIHRDLKPENIMIGSFGEVLVMDWGIAKILDGEESRSLPEIDVTNRRRTRMGAVSGTPSYMSKEQALGLITKIGTHSDVFSLGIILYEILHGKPPFVGNPQSVLNQARKGEDLQPINPPAPVPKGLIRIMKKATQIDWKERYPTAKELSDDLRKWLIGLEKKEKGRKKVNEAFEKEKELQILRDRSVQILKKKQVLSLHINSTAPIEKKKTLWDIEDQEQDILINIMRLEQEILQLLRSALTYDESLTEALQAIADYHYKRHNELSSQRSIEAEKHLLELAYYDQGKYHNYLSGDGQCHLQTNTVAKSTLYKYKEENRRLLHAFERDLGSTPLIGISLPMGSYLVLLEAPNCEILNLPIFIPRGEIYINNSPISGMIEPVQLLEKGSLKPQECYVPGGWCIQGEANYQMNPYRKIWVNSFIIQKFPITNREYINFLNEVSKSEGFEIASTFANKMENAFIYSTKNNGEFVEFFLDIHSNDFEFQEEDPVIGVNFYQAERYAQWYADKTNHPWRLPSTEEWEKAACGVDGRSYPWGNHLELTYVGLLESQNGGQPFSVHSFPIDCSVYGVRGLGGNVQDWCDINSEEHAVCRGGSWQDSQDQLAIKLYSKSLKSVYSATTSIRLVKNIYSE
jgi:eukaryotic-like serine/threonine-protein kinase